MQASTDLAGKSYSKLGKADTVVLLSLTYTAHHNILLTLWMTYCYACSPLMTEEVVFVFSMPASKENKDKKGVIISILLEDSCTFE